MSYVLTRFDARRAVDIGLAVAALVLTGPLLALVGALVKLTSSGPMLYRAARVGQDGRPFTLYKFRSMRVSSAGQGARLTRGNDPRLTRIGRVLRTTKIDEIPQFFNVLKGDMSIVGPRPEDPRYVSMYSPDQRQVLSVRPGITSPASIAYRDEAALLNRADWEQHYINTIMPEKLRMDLEYVRQRTLWSDFRVVARTISALWHR